MSGYFYCWRCNWQPLDKTLSKLLGITKSQSMQLIKEYDLKKTGFVKSSNDKITIKRKKFKLPSNLIPLKSNHKHYLKKRRFDPEQIIEDWEIQGTGPVSLLDEISYKHRIFIPIIYNGEMVSFQTRDITDKSKLKYMACPKNREIINHQHVLYGLDKVGKRNTPIIVEGVTDVWCLGFGAIATFGISYTNEQVNLITERFKKVVVMFDGERQAQRQAKMLCSELEFRGVETDNVLIQGDPAELTDEQVKEIREGL